MVLDLQHGEMAPTTEALLFSAARAQLVAERIQPYLKLGGIVVCDRFADAMLAYQGYGQGRDLNELQVLTQLATGGLKPDITLLIDVPVEVGLDRKRAAERPALSPLSPRHDPSIEQPWNRLDARETAFHERVRRGYQQLASAEPERWLTLDGQATPDMLATAIWQAVQQRVLAITPLEQKV